MEARETQRERARKTEKQKDRENRGAREMEYIGDSVTYAGAANQHNRKT